MTDSKDRNQVKNAKPRAVPFGVRVGAVTSDQPLIIDSAPPDMRNRLWNILDWATFGPMGDCLIRSLDPEWHRFLIAVWDRHLKWRLDDMGGSYLSSPRGRIRKHFLETDWWRVYELLEFAVAELPNRANAKLLSESCNSIFETERSGYRFISATIVPITSPTEIESVTSAASVTAPFETSAVHMRAAIAKLAERPKPDLRNSIKESVHAVEAACRVVSGKKNATLAEALKILEKNGFDMHPAFRSALDKLWGYTSDANGIRHSLMDAATLDYDDAKFFVVACSAFVNYLVSRSAKLQVQAHSV